MYQLAKAAEVQKSLCTMVHTIPERQLRTLTSFPPEERRNPGQPKFGTFRSQNSRDPPPSSHQSHSRRTPASSGQPKLVANWPQNPRESTSASKSLEPIGSKIPESQLRTLKVWVPWFPKFQSVNSVLSLVSRPKNAQVQASISLGPIGPKIPARG